MKGFLQEYGIIMVVVAVVLGMLAFGKTGYAKSIQEAILGSADHIVETGENITKEEIKASDTIDIEGTKYIVLEKQGKHQALVMTARSVRKSIFQSYSGSGADIKRPDGQSISTYEGSEIDNYLENEWYNGLSSTMKTAIQSTNIQQESYAIGATSSSGQKTGPNGQVYNITSRHVFLPSVSEVKKVVDYKNQDKVSAFLNGTNGWIWTRDSSVGYHNAVMVLTHWGFDEKITDYDRYTSGLWVCPTFSIDLSKVDYKVTGHTDYK